MAETKKILEESALIRMVRTKEDFFRVINLNRIKNYDRIALAIEDVEINNVILKREFHQLQKAGISYAYEKCESNGILGITPQKYYYCGRVA